ncbi:decarboxylating 6-phosphogluconate dehydrogenase [bacterium]|nr:MAG: decarboxylating 6-phosphogluconate dehydrogenase [bacterium]
MEIGIAGLGRMGGGIAGRLLGRGHRVTGYDASADAVRGAAAKGAAAARSLAELVNTLAPPRAVWLMLPAGAPTGETIEKLSALLAPGDLIIDGGNSHYRDSMQRAKELAEKEILFVDVGVSGGVWGLENGYSLMAGGEKSAIDRIAPVLRDLAPAPDKGWGHVGPAGAGHFVKMVHNGIEYGLMQAYAEGFNLLFAKKEFDFDLEEVANIWRHGTVIRSWLLDLTAEALGGNPTLSGVSPKVSDSGEGRWTVAEAAELGVPVPVISASLMQRFASGDGENFGNRLLSALRHEFGGHKYKSGE